MNGNYVQKKDGWHKTDQSQIKGNADYFAKTPPPHAGFGRPPHEEL